ncbi:hypothetical protein GRF59_11840 [Paenibacillus sp. HJL G12]|uniref:STAS/SEC14 domain-containing protein n=1 Tax=Paenibacillus dendrobii TaxID=2691084 RepID=A0A7X3II29_9BACL|nr:hypothetical protein [Paenibacillus dendrobii]MWV44322.1 hypothetical protein [Paenibacillus dendrobii]
MGIRKWLGSIFNKQIKSVPDLRPSFSLYHHGGEIWISCLDNLGSDMQLIKEKVNNNEDLMRTANKQARVLYHLDGTDVIDETAEYIMESLRRTRHHIFKIAIVGVTRSGKNNFNKCLENETSRRSLGIKYFSSMDQAKDWLVSERF